MLRRALRELLGLATLRGFTRADGGAQVVMVLGWLSLFGAPILLALFLFGVWP